MYIHVMVSLTLRTVKNMASNPVCDVYYWNCHGGRPLRVIQCFYVLLCPVPCGQKCTIFQSSTQIKPGQRFISPIPLIFEEKKCVLAIMDNEQFSINKYIRLNICIRLFNIISSWLLPIFICNFKYNEALYLVFFSQDQDWNWKF